jgi:excisionase family DNA binding protein
MGAPDTLGERLLRTSDVAALFQVSERTVSEWGRRGRIPSVRTPSGHRRYPASAIKGLLLTASEGGGDPPTTEAPSGGRIGDEILSGQAAGDASGPHNTGGNFG